MRAFLARHLRYPRRNQRYTLSQMSLALIYPSWLGLGRIESSSFPRSNGMFQYLTGLPDGPDQQTWRRFLSGAPPDFRHQLHRTNRRLQQPFIQWPEPRSRLILDWDGTAVTVCGHQEPAEVGCHPRYRGQRSYNPWKLTPRSCGTRSFVPARRALGRAAANGWPVALRACRRTCASCECGRTPALVTPRGWICSQYVPSNTPWLRAMPPGLKRKVGGLKYHRCNPRGEIAALELQRYGRTKARRVIVARRPIEPTEPEPTLFHVGRYLYRAGITNLPLTPEGGGTSMLAVPAWRRASMNSERTLRCVRSRRATWLRMRSIWKAFAWPTIWSRLSSGPACRKSGQP